MTTARAGWLAGLAMTLLASAGWALDAPYLLALPLAALIAWSVSYTHLTLPTKRIV